VRLGKKFLQNGKKLYYPYFTKLLVSSLSFDKLYTEIKSYILHTIQKCEEPHSVNRKMKKRTFYLATFSNFYLGQIVFFFSIGACHLIRF
jgi:hypothetical protein